MSLKYGCSYLSGVLISDFRKGLSFFAANKRKFCTISFKPLTKRTMAYIIELDMESVRIAIVEDDKTASDTLLGYIGEYGRENAENFETACFYNAATFLSAFKDNFDVVFMDIELPDGNGMDVVKRLRGMGGDVIVIFVTNMAQYAVKGYEVRAFDFIVKPVVKYNFAVKFKSALECFRRKAEVPVWVSSKEGKMRLSASRIKYIEVYKHVLVYHTLDGDFQSSGSLCNLEEQLAPAFFASCNRCYLVNLRYVTAVRQFSVVVGGEELQISRMKRSSFMRGLNAYLSGSD